MTLPTNSKSNFIWMKLLMISLAVLPDEILQDIFGYLTLEDAVRTTVLSKLWRRHWKPSIITLNFGNCSSKKAEVARAVAEFMASDNKSLKLCDYIDDEMRHERVILVANKVVGGAELIHLNSPLQVSRMPLEIFKLVLVMNNFPLTPHMTSSVLDHLKVLQLHSITGFSKDIVQEIFSSCCGLQSLSLAKCSGLKSLEIQANNCFKKLELIYCSDITHILISAKYIESFGCIGFMPLSIQIQNAEFLVNVFLDFRHGMRQQHTMFDCEAVLSLLEDVKNVKNLTISGWLIQWLCSAGVIFARLGFRFKFLREMRWVCRAIDEHKMNSVDCFLKIAPALQSFSMEVDPSYNPVPCPAFHHFWHDAHL